MRGGVTFVDETQLHLDACGFASDRRLATMVEVTAERARDAQRRPDPPPRGSDQPSEPAADVSSIVSGIAPNMPEGALVIQWARGADATTGLQAWTREASLGEVPWDLSPARQRERLGRLYGDASTLLLFGWSIGADEVPYQSVLFRLGAFAQLTRLELAAGGHGCTLYLTPSAGIASVFRRVAAHGLHVVTLGVGGRDV
jgi:hypothetical protein